MATETQPSNHTLVYQEEFVIKEEQLNANFVKYTTISINERDETPFHKTVLPLPHNTVSNLHFGSIVKTSEDKWTKKHDFSEHKYDYVVVLEKHINSITVFGNKIGEHAIKINNEHTYIERGDHLLLDTHYDTIVHNITRAKMKYDIQRMSRCKEK